MHFDGMIADMIFSVRSLAYFLQSILDKSIASTCRDYEFGMCSMCGRFSKFIFYKMFNNDSFLVVSCGYDEKYTEELNVTNTLNCSFCESKYRVRCAAESLLKYFWRGKILSITGLIEKLNSDKIQWKALEVGSMQGIFTNYGSVRGVIISEYYNDTPRGEYNGIVRSEDLMHLTFEPNSFDAIIALDVFEHIADPWKAFSEIQRVLRLGGVGIVTVPLELRVKKTETVAKIYNGKIEFLKKPAYHTDPLGKDGSLVFTEFGTDIIEKLKDLGFNASCDVYKKRNATQYVILIKKL